MREEAPDARAVDGRAYVASPPAQESDPYPQLRAELPHSVAGGVKERPRTIMLADGREIKVAREK